MTLESDDNHGNSPAAWTAVIVMLVGVTAGTIFFWFEIVPLVWVSAGIVVIGAILGKVLQKLGYGVNGSKYAPKAHH